MDRHINKFKFRIFVVALFFLVSCSENKDSINIAVASNFEKTLEQIIHLYQQQSTNEASINIIAASSGVLSSQIINNAPYDLFLSADDEKTYLIKKKLNLTNNIPVYAIGKLALWIPEFENNSTCLKKLNSLKTLAVANPKTAPYGKIATEIIKKSSIKVKKVINTASVSQTYLYTRDNFTQAGFVPYSMLNKKDKGCIQIFEDNQLSQSMILLNNKALDIHQFILSNKIQSLIKESGYSIQQSN